MIGFLLLGFIMWAFVGFCLLPMMLKYFEMEDDFKGWVKDKFVRSKKND